MPKIGDIEDGHRYIGGDPANKASWILAAKPGYEEKIQQFTPEQISGQMRQYSAGIPTQQQVEQIGPATAFAGGQTMGFLDELMGLVQGQPGQELTRNIQKQYRQQSPVSSTLLGLGGGLSTGFGLAPAIPKAVAAAPAVLQYPLLGATAGAVSGFGEAEGGIMERLPEAGMGAAIGGLTGLALPIAGAVIKQPLQWLKGRLKAPGKIGRKEIIKALERDGFTPTQAEQRLKDLGPNATLADLGPNTQALAGATARQPGKAMTELTKFYDMRAENITKRMLPSLRKFTGNDKEAFSTLKQIAEKRATEAGPLYKQAHEIEVPGETMSSVLSNLDNRIAEVEGSNIARALQNFRNKLTGKTSIRQIDAIKQDMDDKIGTLYKAGKNNQGRALKDAKNMMLEQIDQVAPVYGQARNIFAGHKQVENALTLGKRILRDDFDEMADLVENMSKAESEAFVTGAIKTVRDSMLKAKVGNNAARQFSAPLIQERMRNIFPDEQSFKTFMSQLDIEEMFQKTRGEVLKGSQTAARQTAEEALKEETGQGFSNYARNVIQDLIGRPREEMTKEIGKQILTPDFQQLQKAIPMLSPEQQQQIMNALTIGTGAQAGGI